MVQKPAKPGPAKPARLSQSQFAFLEGNYRGKIYIRGRLKKLFKSTPQTP